MSNHSKPTPSVQLNSNVAHKDVHMKHENEIVNSRIVLRVVSGLLALGGVVALGSMAVQVASGQAIDWWSMAMLASAIYGTYIFGRYAITGRLAFVAKGRNTP